MLLPRSTAASKHPRLNTGQKSIPLPSQQVVPRRFRHLVAHFALLIKRLCDFTVKILGVCALVFIGYVGCASSLVSPAAVLFHPKPAHDEYLSTAFADMNWTALSA